MTKFRYENMCDILRINIYSLAAQAIECKLADIEPINKDKGWDREVSALHLLILVILVSVLTPTHHF